jgi:hypothetical protein
MPSTLQLPVPQKNDGRWKIADARTTASLGSITKTFRFPFHPVQHCEYLFILTIQVIKQFLSYVPAGQGKFQPGLGLGSFLCCIGQLIKKNGFVPALSPPLGNIGAD